MPSNVQSILTAITPLNATKDSEIADRILEVTPPEVSKISSSDSSANLNSANSHSDLIEEIRALRKEVALLRFLNKFIEGHKNKKKSSRPSKKPENPLQWSDEADQAFILTKQALANATLLKYPIPGAALSLWSDASDEIGSSLMQLCNDKWEPIAFLSRRLAKRDTRAQVESDWFVRSHDFKLYVMGNLLLAIYLSLWQLDAYFGEINLGTDISTVVFCFIIQLNFTLTSVL
ncbi:Retrovirus-related Pol polyprotein like [Argiope bruennichi]|uniref:Retrovirus-related Pol polyprotein like n=1 Tax=Argiope bruennichi TaxID=94029 RepID=A0A8T0EP36_ARGBR|nr:Retrovirus-related Pol polyprotein like [Argiope bruennichi]